MRNVTFNTEVTNDMGKIPFSVTLLSATPFSSCTGTAVAFLLDVCTVAVRIALLTTFVMFCKTVVDEKVAASPETKIDDM